MVLYFHVLENLVFFALWKLQGSKSKGATVAAPPQEGHGKRDYLALGTINGPFNI